MKKLLTLIFLLFIFNSYSQYDTIRYKTYRGAGFITLSASITGYGIGTYIYTQPRINTTSNVFKYTYGSIWTGVGLTCNLMSINYFIKARKIKHTKIL